MINNPFDQQVQAKKYGDTSRFTGMQVDPDIAKVNGTGTPFQAGGDIAKAPSKLASGVGGALGAIGQMFGSGQAEDDMPPVPPMQPGQIIGKNPFQLPQLPQMQAGLGQSALL